jgi:hypothetical protein
MSNTSSFTLVSSTGAKYRAQEIGSRINTSDLSGKSSIPGLSKFQLLDGRALNKKSESTFVLVATGEELRREQP